MSESPKNLPTDKPSRSGRPPRTPTNPFEGSALFSSGPPLPDLSSPSSEAERAQPPAAPAEQRRPSSLLYNTQPPPDYILRPFEQRHDRQTIYIDARKAGALDALVKLVARNNKTDLVDQMVNDILAKYADVLQENEELVKLLEEKYRKKHNL
ncbi:MAG: hypothetical protein ACYDER_08015 [Ktedonobacteraceae bacterium]